METTVKYTVYGERGGREILPELILNVIRRVGVKGSGH